MTTKKICPNCGALRDFARVERTQEFKVRSEIISITSKLEVCSVCHQSLFDEKRDEAILERAYAEYRQRKSLLLPSDIKVIREKFGLSQRAFALLLGVAQPTIARYEQGALQDEAHDQLMRVYAKIPNMRVLLENRGHLIAHEQRHKALDRMRHCRLSERIEICNLVHGGPDEFTGFRTFDFPRYIKSVVWFCFKLERVPVTAMNKLLFYADYGSYKTRSVSLTGTAYQKLQYGPVPQNHGTLRDLMESEGYIMLREVPFHDFTGVVFEAGPRALELELDFDEEEIRVLEMISTTLGRCTARDLSRKSHQEKAWTETIDRALISYNFAESLLAL